MNNNYKSPLKVLKFSLGVQFNGIDAIFTNGERSVANADAMKNYAG